MCRQEHKNTTSIKRPELAVYTYNYDVILGAVMLGQMKCGHAPRPSRATCLGRVHRSSLAPQPYLNDDSPANSFPQPVPLLIVLLPNVLDS
jgi:hypothetical protein